MSTCIPTIIDRLRGILPRIVDEARQALDAEVESLNRASLGERLKLSRRRDPKITPPEGGWQIQILENTDDDVEPGDIVIYSELALPAKPEFGGGHHDQAHRHAALGRNAVVVRQLRQAVSSAPP